MSAPQKNNKIAKRTRVNKNNRLGRILKEDSISVFESYSFLKQNVGLISSIFNYIDTKYHSVKARRSKNVYETMLQKVLLMKEETFQSITNGEINKEKGKMFYNLLDYFLQSLEQIPKNIYSLDPLVGNYDWNQYLAQSQYVIPSNIMDLIIEKEYGDIQIFSLMALEIYSMANEEMAIDILNIFQSYLTQQKLKVQDIPLFAIFQKYIDCFIEKINLVEKKISENEESKIDNKLKNYQNNLKNLLINLSNAICIKAKLSVLPKYEEESEKSVVE